MLALCLNVLSEDISFFVNFFYECGGGKPPWTRTRLYIILFIEVGRIFFIHIQKKLNKEGQGKQNKTKENYVQRTTIYNNHIGNQQINSSGTAYLLMC